MGESPIWEREREMIHSMRCYASITATTAKPRRAKLSMALRWTHGKNISTGNFFNGFFVEYFIHFFFSFDLILLLFGLFFFFFCYLGELNWKPAIAYHLWFVIKLL